MAIRAVGSLADDELPRFIVLAHEVAAAAFALFEPAGDQFAPRMRVQKFRGLRCHVARQSRATLGPAGGQLTAVQSGDSLRTSWIANTSASMAFMSLLNWSVLFSSLILRSSSFDLC